MAPIYDYKAYTPNGKVKKGIVEADTQKSARQKLKKQHLMVTEMKTRTSSSSSSSGSRGFSFGGGVGVKDVALMTRQLASLIKANIPLVDALGALVDQIDHPKLKFVLSQVKQEVNEGISLAKSMGKHPRIFDHIFINMVEAGEQSGTLGLVLLRLADLKEAQMRLRSKVIGGMMYPVLMIFVAVSMMLGIFTFVIPKLAKIFESMNKPIPATTQFVMDISDIIVGYWYLLGAGAFLCVFLFKTYIQTKSGRYRWDRIKLKAVLFGPLLRMIAVTRFSSTMSTLLSSGVPIVACLNISKNLVGNVHIANAIETARENITEGQSIADPLKKSGEFPPLVIHMISIGEKTGELPEMLGNVASTYEEQVNTKIETMTGLIEPLMIIMMGGMIGFIVLSIFLPLMELNNIQ
tara:strand:- start:3983 stop:5203 length:1221 start_codon:yes stop_codon:yes gene_type:complete